jgi:GntR family transcriptional regulator
VPGLIAGDLIEGASLYGLLTQRYGIHVHSDEGRVMVAPMTQEEAQLLGATSGAPAMIYKGVIFDRDNRPVEYLVSVNHAQRVIFKFSNIRAAN